ncbi:MAG: efflux RND transporter periplasmic adaptor subunit [Opitutaceae bacterium]|nr:efflux RND transporter periplasmic adaptor subunit [Opitutaceae bacterium]
MKFPFPFHVARVVLLLVLFVTGLLAAEQLWTCGMHPQIIKKQPGPCPVCAMALTPIRANTGGGGERKIQHYKSTMSAEVSPKPAKDSMGMDMVPVYEGGDSSAPTIQIDAATVQRMNLKTDLVTRGPVKREIRSVGSVAYDERTFRDITIKYEGWVEKLLVNATWTPVKTGDPLFEIYSPELYNAQLNYVVGKRGEGPQGGPLTRAALARLQLFDLAPEFIAALERGGEAQRTYVYRAPAAGIVVEKMAVAGQMMKPGERIYRLADLSSVWIHAQIYENDLAFVRPGQAATVRATFGPQRDLTGEVALILPQISEQTRTATARIVLPNAEGDLRPGMFVDVRFSVQLSDSAVLVPETAVLRSGERNTVFIARDGGSFEPREIKLGARSQDGRYEVIEGLADGERVVTSGQFMLDSESQLREAIQKMLKAGDTSTAGTMKQAAAEMPVPETLKTLALAMADAATPLAADDLAGYSKQLPAVRAALAAYLESAPQSPLAKFKDSLSEPADLDAARRAFEPVSTAVADVGREHHLHHTAGLHVFECPMAPVAGKGRWLQRTGELKNPFFGSKMLTCGAELK